MTKEKKNSNKKAVFSAVVIIIILAAAAVFVTMAPKLKNDTAEDNAKTPSISAADSTEDDTEISKEIKSGEEGTSGTDASTGKIEISEEIAEQFPDEIKAVEVEAAPGVDYKKGTITETTYESEFLGLKYIAQEGWTNVSEEELEKMPSQEGTACELQSYNDKDKSSLAIILEKLPADTITTEMYMDSIKNSIHNTTEFEISNLNDAETATIAEETYKVLSYSIKQNDISYYQRYYLRQIGDYMAVISISAQSAEDVGDSILNSFIKY